MYCSPRCIHARYRHARAERDRQARASLRMECANPACGRAFTPQLIGRTPRYCSSACRHAVGNRNRPTSAEADRKLTIACYLAVITDKLAKAAHRRGLDHRPPSAATG